MTSIKIKGMTCQHCVQAVTQALKNIEGISSVSVDLGKGEARYEEDRPVAMETVKKAIQEAGYQVV
jgi:copper chaperone